MHKMATHCAYTLTESSTHLIILGKMYIVNTLQILGEIPGEAGEAGQSFSKKNGHMVFCITILNQNLDKT